MKHFDIWRDRGVVLSMVWEDGIGHLLSPRSDLKDYPDVFYEYGDASDGTAQLALTMLAQIFSDEQALAWHQQYKMDYLMHFQEDKIMITEQSIRSWASVKGFIHSEKSVDHGGSPQIHGEQSENL